MGRQPTKKRLRLLLAFGLAIAVVLVDSTSRLLSICADLVIVGLLLAVLLIGRPKVDA